MMSMGSARAVIHLFSARAPIMFGVWLSTNSTLGQYTKMMALLSLMVLYNFLITLKIYIL